MKFSPTLLASLLVTTATAFSPSGPRTSKTISKTDAVANAVVVDTKKRIDDPLGLYPRNSPERKQGLIPDDTSDVNKPVIDPLSIYSDKSEVTYNADMSASLPFLQRPDALDGSLAGDRGFDPFNLASDADALAFYRTSELKHARLAMLAAVGWPLAELFHKNIAANWGLDPILNAHDRVPSVLNGGLGNVSPVFWASTLALAAVIEICSGALAESGIQSGDLGFDPLGLGGKRDENKQRYMKEAEIFNGRLGMLAITGFAIQEWFTHDSVVDAIPIFFKPLNLAMEQLLNAGAHSI